MACLYLLRAHLDRITVYWVNAGDELPETAEIIEACKAFIPHFVEIKADSVTWRVENGVPSDLVPTSGSSIGMTIGLGTLRISDRFSCCSENLMRPMHTRMKEDGITLIIRGQKRCDMPNVPFVSGQSADGFEFFYPIEEWTNHDVFDYLRTVGAPIHPIYEYGEQGANCATCTAWWGDAQHEFRRIKHPEIHAKLIPVMQAMRGAIDANMRHLEALNYHA